VILCFAQADPRFEGPINVALFEAVLGYSRARGPAPASGGDGRAR
jgi:hypothetical protein